MSLFDHNIIEQSGDWVVEQLYKKSDWIDPVTKQPLRLTNKETNKEYESVYSMFRSYCDGCRQLDYIGSKFIVTREGRKRWVKRDRAKFIAFVRENCQDRILYKNNYYYSLDWYWENLGKNPINLYFDFLIPDEYIQ